jgi:3-phosphoglycerate kinase
LEKAEKKGVKLLLPVDNRVGKEFNNDTESKVVCSTQIPADYIGLDIGPKSIELFSNVLKEAKTVVWNGPMGVFEFPNFAIGTKEIAKAVAESGATIYRRWRRLCSSSRTAWICR